jgi:hypothetical protein
MGEIRWENFDGRTLIMNFDGEISSRKFDGRISMELT